MNRKLTLLLALILAFSIMTGCNTGSETKPNSSSGDSVTQEQAESGSENQDADDETDNEDVEPISNSESDESTDNSIYDGVLEKIRSYSETGETEDWDSIPNDVGEAIAISDCEPYYAYSDLNGDGVDELIIGCMMNDQISENGLYTIKDGEVYLPKLYMFSQIYEDGTIEVYGYESEGQYQQHYKVTETGDIEAAEPTTDVRKSFDWKHI